MSVAAEVYLWGSRIGTVALPEGRDYASFEYDRDFLESGIQPSPVTMPLSERTYSFPLLSRQSFHGLPGMLADSLPDRFGNRVIDAWLDAQGRERGSLNPIERLCYTGSRGMGALEYLPVTGPDPSLSDTIDVAALTELAGRILSERESFHARKDDDAMAQIVSVGTSAGGARAKALIAWNERTGDVRSGQVRAGEGYGYWLLKLDGVEGNGDKEGADGPCFTRIEYAYHLMARAAGIDMPECRLYEEGGRRHFLSRRFDRTGTGGKLHMQTLGGLAHFDFNVLRSYSYEQAVEVMRLLDLGQDEVEQFFSRMVFNVMARNQDDHVKNISFLMDRRGTWTLSPAYDLTYAYNPSGAWTGQHQMSVNGKFDQISEDDLLACAHHMSIQRPRAEKRIEEVRDAVGKWHSFAEAALLPQKHADAIARNLNLLDR